MSVSMEEKAKWASTIITGRNSGLGLECGRQFLSLGLTQLILAVRSQQKGDIAAKELKTEFPEADIQVWILDMESSPSVREFMARCNTLERLDVAILNAGCAKQTFQRAKGNGKEMTLQVNYLNTMLLAILLIPILKAKSSSAPGRLTLVTSDMALWVKVKDTEGSILDSIDKPENFDGANRYSTTKLFLIMFTSKLAELVSADDIINIVNPCVVRGTRLMREAKGSSKMIFNISCFLLGRNIVDGTRQFLHSALVLGKESHGSYGDWEIRPYPVIMYTESGQKIREKLWSETLEDLRIRDIATTLGRANKHF
ncbi:short-chain dehydrogenase reductase family [Fusarium beomiforme]|uniref:Short-chain dehydrogenase reductase family n=1 Tax=Fusarium beomiforme TaxID=44412 RepID=A0A9P5E3G9_9HYPO|nr:short-chain dehydrogenase reductase family [Fusarium beomiforme]